MANTRVKKEKKKTSVSLSIEYGVWKRFRGYCEATEKVPSREAERLLVEFLEKQR